MNSPDYQGVDNDDVLNDFLLRIQHYEAQYQTLDEILESHFSFMKIFNTGTAAPSSDRWRWSVISLFIWPQVRRCSCTATRATSRAASSTT